MKKYLKTYNTINKIIQNKSGKTNNLKIVNIILFIISLYFSYTLWYIFLNMGTELIDSLELFYLINMFAIIGCFIYAVFKLLNLSFANSQMTELFMLPVKPLYIVYTVMCSVIKNQINFIFIIFIPLIIFNSKNYYNVVMYFFTSLMINIIIDCFVLIIIILLSILLNQKWLLYLVSMIQYIIIFVTSLMIRSIIINMKLLENNYLFKIVNEIYYHNRYIELSVTLIFSFIIVNCLYKKYYEISYYKLMSNDRKTKLGRSYFHKLRMPYIFLETKQLIRNNSLLVKAILRSIIIFIFLSGWLINKASLISKEVVSISWMVNIALLSSMNSISSTSYTRDSKDYMNYKMMPVNLKSVFCSKVLVSFFINLILVFSYTLFEIFVNGKYSMNIIIYSIMMNFICSWLGVYFDWSNIRTDWNEEKLLHTNMNRIFVIAFSFIKVMIDILLSRFIKNYGYNLINIVMVCFIIFYTNKIFKGNLNDCN